MKKLIILTWLMYLLINTTAQTQSNQQQQNIKKNAVYYELFGNGFWHSVNYDRYVSLGDKSGLILRGGVTWVEEFFALGEVNFISGKGKSHFEAGLGFTAFEGGQVFIRAGYRFHGKKGLLIRAAPLVCVTQGFPWFGISIGYCFK